ncbi:50S ribosomal protein L11 methyltransferase [Pseudomonas sp. nanlin1]|uniref:50S ribosomal protein L11 methyltransferase n=1 Tax=Pseudomonas sp. nanlin1 TaxID=3040605 RepID=UPI00388CF231
MLSHNTQAVFKATALNMNDPIIASIPRWHFPMLNDQQRNKAFFDAIDATDFTDKTVLDIGTGSGLLAMLIARKGARHVYTCESNPLVAAKAEEIIRVNGLEHNITVINKLSTDLISGEDIPRNIEIMISETVDCGFFGEGFGHALAHAKCELLSPSALIIPESVKLHACLLSSQEVANLNYVYDDIFGLDVSAFNSFQTTGYFPVRLQTWPHRLVSNTVEFYSVDFQSEFVFDSSLELAFTADANALAHGIVFWFDLFLKQDTCLSNDPHNIRSHWMQAVQLFDCPLYVRKSQDYRVSLNLSCDGVRFGKELSPRLFENIAS